MNRAGYLKHKDLIDAWANGAEIEYYDCDQWYYMEKPNWHKDTKYRIKPAEPEFTYPMWFANKTTNTIVKFTSLTTGTVIDRGEGMFSAGVTTNNWIPHTDTRWIHIHEPKEKYILKDREFLTQIPEPKPKKTIVLNTYLFKNKNGYYTREYDADYTIGGNRKYLEILSTREVTINE